MGLNTVARDNLVEAILNLPNIHTQDRRDQIVKSLGSIAAHVPSAAEPRAHVVYIVDTSLEFVGGLKALSSALRLLYEGATALRPVLTLLSAMQQVSTTPRSAEGPTVDEMLELLTMECDRHHNLERFGYIYGQQWSRNTPVAFVMAADEQECCAEFVLRLVRRSLQQLEAKHRYLQLMDAPPPLAFVDLVFPDLTDKSSCTDQNYLNYLARERLDLMIEKYAHLGELFTQQYPWYAVSTVVTSDRWRHGEESVEAALTVIADVCQAHALAYRSQKLFAFVVLQTRKDDPALSSGEDRAELAGRVLTSRKVELHRLPALDCVARDDMEKWLENCCKPVIPARDNRDHLCEAVFDWDNLRCLSMKELRRRFRDAYKAWLEAGGNTIGA